MSSVDVRRENGRRAPFAFAFALVLACAEESGRGGTAGSGDVGAGAAGAVRRRPRRGLWVRGKGAGRERYQLLWAGKEMQMQMGG